MKITVIKPQSDKKGIKKVAAYARVSTYTFEQEESFESQVAYYTDLITNISFSSGSPEKNASRLPSVVEAILVSASRVRNA